MPRRKHSLSPAAAENAKEPKRQKASETEAGNDAALPAGAKDVAMTLPTSLDVAESRPDVIPKSKSVSKLKVNVQSPMKANLLDSRAAPLSNIHDFFFDIIRKASSGNIPGGVTDGRMDDEDKPGEPLNSGALDAMLKHRGNSPWQVATMCSGTESPILALSLIQQSLTQAGKMPFVVDHVFSAENNLYKQAYIQRNFSPPLLFRDITKFKIASDKESGNDVMTGLTAFGSLPSYLVMSTFSSQVDRSRTYRVLIQTWPKTLKSVTDRPKTPSTLSAYTQSMLHHG